MAPSVTWSTKRVFITYRNLLTGSKEAGTWDAVASGRIVNTLTDGTKQVFRPGKVASGSLNVTEGTPSLDFQLPIVDDPDNSPQGGEITLTITFASGGTEVFHLSPLNAWPDAGTDLALILDPTTIAAAPIQTIKGVAGGIAALDSNGDVVNAAGVKVLPGGSGGVSTTEAYASQVNGGSSVTVDLSGTSTVFPILLNSASCAVSFTGAANGRAWTVKFKQDTTGNRAATLPGVTLVGGTSLTLTSTANGVTFVSFLKDADGTFAFVPGTSSGTTTTPPGQTVGLAAGTATSASQPLTWTATATATSYLVEYKLTSGSTWTSFGSVSSPSVTVTSLAASTSYDYRVTPSNAGGNGTVSATLTASTAAAAGSAPGQTVGLTAGTATSTTQPLTWTATSTATSYLVEYKLASATPWTSFGSVATTSATVTGLTAATSYNYRVTPSNGSGAGTTSVILTNSTAAAVVSSLRLVGERNARPSDFLTDTGGTFQLKQVARTSVSSLELNFVNWGVGTSAQGDLATGNSITIGDCFVVTNAGSNPVTLNRVTFSGSNSVTLTDGASVIGTCAIPLTAGTTYYIRTYVSPAAGGRYPRLALGSIDYPGELSQKGSNVASNTNNDFTTFLTAYGDVFGPVSVSGVTTSTHASVAVLGDSIAFGIGDDFSSTTTAGFAYRALAGNRPFSMIAVPGESLGDFLTTHGDLRRTLLTRFDYMLSEYGINDLQQGATLATLQARWLSVWTDAVTRNPSGKVYQTTLTPKTSTTDSWATVANQTSDGTVEPVRVPANTWLRAGAPIDPSSKAAVAVGTSGALLSGSAGHPLSGIFEIADLAESARNSGKWKAAYTADGIHPNATGHAALAAGVTISTLVPV